MYVEQTEEQMVKAELSIVIFYRDVAEDIGPDSIIS